MERFAHTEKTAAVYNRLIKEYREIQSDGDLEALGLDYDDYRYELGLFLDGLRYSGEGTTRSERVAEWARSRGCGVSRTALDCWKATLSREE